MYENCWYNQQAQIYTVISKKFNWRFGQMKTRSGLVATWCGKNKARDLVEVMENDSVGETHCT
jgi:hypothetical protein